MNIGLDIDGVLTDIEKFQKAEGQNFFEKDISNDKGFTIQEMFNCSEQEEHDFWKKNLLKYAIT